MLQASLTIEPNCGGQLFSDYRFVAMDPGYSKKPERCVLLSPWVLEIILCGSNWP